MPGKTTEGPRPEAQEEQVSESPNSSLESSLEFPVAGLPTSGRRAFSEIRRQLSEKELTSAGVQKLIIENLDRAELECERLQGFVERYYTADKRAAVLEEQVRSKRAFDILHSLCLTVGGVLVGLFPALSNSAPLGFVSLGLGLLLIALSSVAKLYFR